MKEKINIAEILNGKPVNTKLWSPLFGDVYTSSICREDTIIVVNHHAESSSFYNNGKYFNHAEAELLLFPSKEMRDWEKFSWKKGDVLISDCGFVCIFKEWASDDYTRFNGCYFDGMPNAETAKFDKLDNNTAYDYIREIENRCGGKLNPETLKIEKQPKFKDGDILSCDEDSFTRHTTLILHKDENIIESIVSLVRHKKLIETNVPIDNFLLSRLYHAREDEKKELFDALAKGGKAWDAEKKQIVDLKPKIEFKSFDKVVVRDTEYSTWCADLFSHIDEDYRYACVGATWSFCIPYNEETAKLIGTTNNVEG